MQLLSVLQFKSYMHLTKYLEGTRSKEVNCKAMLILPAEDIQ